MKQERIEAIMTAKDYIEKLIPAVKETAEKMYSGNEQEGVELVPVIADGLEYIYTIVKLTENVFGEIENIEDINSFLQEIVTALENEDFILVGDLFNYEILPILENVNNAFIKVTAN